MKRINPDQLVVGRYYLHSGDRSLHCTSMVDIAIYRSPDTYPPHRDKFTTILDICYYGKLYDRSWSSDIFMYCVVYPHEVLYELTDDEVLEHIVLENI